jgi:trans-aconitate methyltransferase
VEIDMALIGCGTGSRSSSLHRRSFPDSVVPVGLPLG